MGISSHLSPHRDATGIEMFGIKDSTSAIGIRPPFSNTDDGYVASMLGRQVSPGFQLNFRTCPLSPEPSAPPGAGRRFPRSPGSREHLCYNSPEIKI